MSETSHGLLLQEQGRLEEAEVCFRNVLAREPDNDFVHSRLALCQMSQEGRKKEALASIEEAIRLRADEGFYHAVRALVLADLHRTRDALDSADRAIAFAPEDSFALSAKASVYSAMQRWADAEEWCRKALAIDAENALASNLLTHVLRLQGKGEENEAAVAQLLADDPENSLAHVNAGWAALARHDHGAAETHFREALRLDPESDAARQGLLESFKARSWFYRTYLRYCFFMQRFTAGKQWLIIIGLYVVYRVAKEVMDRVHPVLAGGLIVLWLGFVMWVWLAPGIGNFLVFLDRSARHALRASEKRLGLAVGGGLCAGVVLTAVGIATAIDGLFVPGVGLLLATVPASLAFDNESRNGRIVFGLITAFVVLGAVVAAWDETVLHPQPGLGGWTGLLALPVVLATVACTWLGNIPSLRRASE